MLCALIFSAIASQAASAGQTAFTCVEGSPAEFVTEHCVSSDTGTKKFHHVAFSGETHVKLSNAKTNASTTGSSNLIFKETIAATTVEFETTGAIEGLGSLKNEEVGGEMRSTATTNANGLVLNGVIVKSPAGKGCKIFEDTASGTKGTEGVVKTKPLTVRTIVTGTTHEVVFEPVTPSILDSFFIECERGKGVPEQLEGTWEGTGTFKCPTHGVTIECSHSAITTQGTLKEKGAKAGLEGKLTMTAGKLPESEPTHPIAVTTTTP